MSCACGGRVRGFHRRSGRTCIAWITLFDRQTAARVPKSCHRTQRLSRGGYRRVVRSKCANYLVRGAVEMGLPLRSHRGSHCLRQSRIEMRQSRCGEAPTRDKESPGLGSLTSPRWSPATPGQCAGPLHVFEDDLMESHRTWRIVREVGQVRPIGGGLES